MPTYEYVCSKCDREFEIVQSISAPTLSICPKEVCDLKPWGKGKVKRRISAGAGLLFKGSGFYITDYRSENYKAGAKNEAKQQEGKSDSAKTESKSKEGGSKPESKSEGKTESKSEGTSKRESKSKDKGKSKGD